MLEHVVLPVVPLRGLVILPGNVVTFDVSRKKSLTAIEEALDKDKRIFVTAQLKTETEKPDRDDVYPIGAVAKIRQIMRLPDDVMRVLVAGEYRALVVDWADDGVAIHGNIIGLLEDKGDDPKESLARVRVIRKTAQRVRKDISPEMTALLRSEQDEGRLCDIAAGALVSNVEVKQGILEETNVPSRAEKLLQALADEISIAELEQKIVRRVHENIENSNHEYFLREQIHEIQKELGDDEDEDVRELRRRLAACDMPDDARKAAEKELSRLARTAVNTPESGVSMNYLEFMLSLPWNKSGSTKVSLDKARRVLERDHYGMKDVKERILEHLAVMALDDKIKSPVICLVGPPGVGKTSIARSVAEALGRSFCRMSLGGVHDEAEVRGHRRTYVGALPGHILSAIETCGENDPVFLLDEIDKVTRDMRGDPASALLEALDPEQNARFRDHYLDTPFDLSKVFFITTANSLEPIDRALLDRMEIIHVDSYTPEDKLRIAQRHLFPRQMALHGLKKDDLSVSKAAVRAMISQYTREGGVRELERMTQKICRRAALKITSQTEREKITVRDTDLKEFLGLPKYLKNPVGIEKKTGCVNGLAWTETGGEVLPIEAVMLPGKGKTGFTGMLGDVMKESCEIAVSNVRLRLARYGIADDCFEKHDLHVHLPEGAVPKDGPSAGAALACCILSAVTGLPARRDIAMTGELTLLGDVLPIGGVKEKLLAARRSGITEILLPRENERDLEKIDEEERKDLSVHLIDSLDQAIGYILGENTVPDNGRKGENA